MHNYTFAFDCILGDSTIDEVYAYLKLGRELNIEFNIQSSLYDEVTVGLKNEIQDINEYRKYKNVLTALRECKNIHLPVLERGVKLEYSKCNDPYMAGVVSGAFESNAINYLLKIIPYVTNSGEAPTLTKAESITIDVVRTDDVLAADVVLLPVYEPANTGTGEQIRIVISVDYA